jgi:hypothetical protein
MSYPSIHAVPTMEAQSQPANAAPTPQSIHATPMQPRSGRLAIARLPPCSPGCRPDLPATRRRLAARRAGLPPRPARTPAPKCPADAQLPSSQMQRQPQAWKSLDKPALVDAALRKRAASRACCIAESPALVDAALKERAAPRAYSGASARGELHAPGAKAPKMARSPAHSLRPLFALDTFVAALRAALGRPAAARLRAFAYSGGPLIRCIGFPSHLRAGHVGSPPPGIEPGVRLTGTRRRRTVR